MKFFLADKTEVRKVQNLLGHIPYGTAKVIGIPGLAISQQRPRTRVIVPKDKSKKPYAQIYTVNAKHRDKLQEQIVRQDFEEVPHFFYALALYKPPASWSDKKTKEAYGTRKVTKPDGTNIQKFYEDLLEGLVMPKDQYLNPTMSERYYCSYNGIIIAYLPSDALEFNLPKVIKDYFITKVLSSIQS
jgi:Holliday junction resolvase RusA-like endonuclease